MEDWVYLLIPPDRNLCVGDMFVINPCAGSYRLHVASKAEAAAGLREVPNEPPTVLVTPMRTLLCPCLISVMADWGSPPWCISAPWPIWHVVVAMSSGICSPAMRCGGSVFRCARGLPLFCG